MSDSNVHERLDAKHERNRQQRIEAIKRWVDYIDAEPPETWGPQQNAVVNDQLDAAKSVETSSAHRRQVDDIANDILDVSRDSEVE